jgi:hypothetical protein
MAQTHLSRLFQAAIEAQQALGKANDTISANMPTLSTFPETQVYIGLNDSETKKQEHDTGRYVSILKRVCVEHGTPFSFDVINGGYIHDDGEYTEENTIVLTFIDIERETVEDIARDLCTLFNQESVLMTTGLVKIQMIRPDSSANEK